MTKEEKLKAKQVKEIQRYISRAPKLLTIGPYRWPITFGEADKFPKLDDGTATWGYCDRDELCIAMAGYATWPCQRRVAEVLLHEALHAHYGVSAHRHTKLRGEEAQVSFFATSMTELFGNNPKFAKWYMEAM